MQLGVFTLCLLLAVSSVKGLRASSCVRCRILLQDAKIDTLQEIDDEGELELPVRPPMFPRVAGRRGEEMDEYDKEMLEKATSSGLAMDKLKATEDMDAGLAAIGAQILMRIDPSGLGAAAAVDQGGRSPSACA